MPLLEDQLKSGRLAVMKKNGKEKDKGGGGGGGRERERIPKVRYSKT